MPQLEGYNLRLLEKNDLPVVLRWRNSERIRSNMYTDHVIDLEEHRAWFERVADDDMSRYLILEHRHEPIGLSYFTDIDKTNGSCVWGFYIGSSDAPRGAGTALGFLSMNFIFGHKEIRKVSGEVLAFNEPSQRLFKRLGFVNEVYHGPQVMKNGANTDVISFSLLADLWCHTEEPRVRDLIMKQTVQV